MLESDLTEQATRAEAIKKLRARHDGLKVRIETMYLDKLDGRVAPEFFDERAAAWRPARRARCLLRQSAEEQRRLLRGLIQSAAWQDGTLRTTLSEPFEILRRFEPGKL